jgi:hypothetical protein
MGMGGGYKLFMYTMLLFVILWMYSNVIPLWYRRISGRSRELSAVCSICVATESESYRCQ